MKICGGFLYRPNRQPKDLRLPPDAIFFGHETGQLFFPLRKVFGLLSG